MEEQEQMKTMAKLTSQAVQTVQIQAKDAKAILEMINWLEAIASGELVVSRREGA